MQHTPNQALLTTFHYYYYYYPLLLLNKKKPTTMTTGDSRFNFDPRFIKQKKKSKNQTEPQEEDNRFNKDSKKKTKDRKKNEIPKVIDYARGRVILESSDEELGSDEEEEDSNSEEDLDSEDDVELGGGGGATRRSRTREQEIDLNEDSGPEEAAEDSSNYILPTRRIAIVNLDWDNLKPIDIYKVFSSLLITPIHNQASSDKITTTTTMPTDQLTKIVEGRVERVRFYKSQFGKERMSKEDIEGPPREIFNSKSKSQIKHSVSQEEESEDDGEDEDDDEDLIDEDRGGEFDEDALRQYQLDRLRYFYAIVELDAIHSSKHVFSEIDGTEFERTANIFDLSYVPDHMEFDEDDLWDECTSDSNDYKGVDFSTDVLRHSKVKLTWDSEDPIRKKYTRLNTQKLTQEEIDELDFKNFIAPGSSDEEEEDPEDEYKEEKGNGSRRHLQFRQLLGLSDQRGQPVSQAEPGSDQELDITFKPGFVDLDAPPPTLPDQSITKKSKNQKIKDKLKSKTEVNHDLDLQDDHHLENQPTFNRKKNQQELELLMMDDLNTGQDHITKEDQDKKDEEQNDRHFDLTQIIKQEKLSSSSKGNKKKIKKLKKSLIEKDGIDDLDRFNLDKDDRRFDSALTYDPEFAIDPSNPQFTKTKNMQDLLHSTRLKRALPSTTTTTTVDHQANSMDPDPSSGVDQSSSVDQLLKTLKNNHLPSSGKSKRVRIS
ncbi:hypothetical protein MJO29_006537 [Puccinia striiformis f. sp. tritici]|nr:hypothetical protein MJO29_006537 [Puccinia striiformis f. sp. tritici]